MENDDDIDMLAASKSSPHPRRRKAARRSPRKAGPRISDTDRAIARSKGYVGAAIIVFILYWFFYLPGLIFNLMYLSEADRTATMAGKKPSGYGCLLVMFIVGALPLILFISIFFGGWLGSLFS